MDTAAVLSPSTEKRLWSSLCRRVETHNRDTRQGLKDSECGKRLREDSLLLLRGFDSIASSLSQLTSTLNNALQGVGDLSRFSSLEQLQRVTENSHDKETQKRRKRLCSLQDSSDFSNSDVLESSNKLRPEQNGKTGNLEKARNLAVAMAARATSLAKELKSLRSDLTFIKERHALLEEENRRLMERDEKGIRPDEDDLVRLQLEALLAEKSRLASENANLRRENQCLNELVEYHQLTNAQDFSESYEQFIHGMRLDFSSPSNSIKGSDVEEEEVLEDLGGGEIPQTPTADVFGVRPSHDEDGHY